MVGFLKEAKMYFGKKHTKGELKKNSATPSQKLETKISKPRRKESSAVRSRLRHLAVIFSGKILTL